MRFSADAIRSFSCPNPDEAGAGRGAKVYEEHLPWTEFVSVSVEAVRLRDAYLKAGVVTAKWATDALHVALASVHRYRCIVMLELQHIVHFEKIPLYHGVNLINGLESLSINPPAEVSAYEN